MPDGGAAEEVKAAGAIVWRPAGRGAQVALIHRPKYDDWSFPKGKLLPGEHVLLAAAREVAEETGLAVTLGRRLPPEHYDVAIPKRVDYWIATVAAAGPVGFAPTAEVDELAWVAASAAHGRLTYPRDVLTLASLRAGPLSTVPLILVRHASAGNKSRWRKDDRSRPLDSRGEKDASMLAELLRCFGTGRVVSSPAERCIATVRPYAALAGTDVEVEPAFEVAKKAAAADPEAAKAIAVLAAAEEPVVVCAHRENMPFLLDAACAELGADSPPGKPLRKGEFMVLHRADGKLAAIERYHPGGSS
ncbi:MAG TPA: NUDIX hydrolase [Streptosporangiaceae bacterium]|nr:NUDIX hydrolase [Streptosporangiaceae bacterium]